MREKCRALQVSIVIAILSLLVCVLLWSPLPSPFPPYFIEFFQMFFGGTLTSSFVTLSIYATEYHTQKRITLENIWNEARSINQKVKTIQYVHLDYSEEAVASYFNETWIAQDFPHTLPKAREYSEKWFKELWNQYYDAIGKDMSDSDYEEMVNNIMIKKASQYLDALNNAIDSYISIAETDWTEFNRLFGIADFLLVSDAMQAVRF